MRTRTCLWLGVVLALLTLSACAAGPNEMVDTGPDPAGFWLGLWHGLISPITFLISLFTSGSRRSKTTATGTTSDSCLEWPPHSAAEQAEVAPQLGEPAAGGGPTAKQFAPLRMAESLYPSALDAGMIITCRLLSG
jgi:hypothetical protein